MVSINSLNQGETITEIAISFTVFQQELGWIKQTRMSNIAKGVAS